MANLGLDSLSRMVNYICVSKIYCVLNNNAFKLFLIEHIGRYKYLTISLVSLFKDVLLLPIFIGIFKKYMSWQ